MNNNQHKVQVSVSLKAYATKDDVYKDIPTAEHVQDRDDGDHFISFQERWLTAREMYALCLNGYTFCHVFEHTWGSEGIFLNFGQKTTKNFKEANALFFDIDDTDLPMKEYIEKLAIKPTFAYPSYSYKPEKQKFRMIYVLTTPIEDAETYKGLYWGMHYLIAACVGEEHHGLDTSMQAAAQYINGTSKELAPLAVYFGCEYDPAMMPRTDAPTKSGVTHGVRLGKKAKKVVITPSLSQDFDRMELKDFLMKYDSEFRHNKYQSDNTELDEEVHAYVVKSDKDHPFAQLKVKFKDGRPTKWTDGDKRRLCVLIAARTFHTIYGRQLTADHLLYLIADYAWRYIDLRDWKPWGGWKALLKYTVMTVIINGLFQSDNKKFIVDKAWCRENGVKPRAQAMRIRKVMKAREVMGNWDASKNIKTNIRLLKEMGINVSEDSITRWMQTGIIPDLKQLRRDAINSPHDVSMGIQKDNRG